MRSGVKAHSVGTLAYRLVYERATRRAMIALVALLAVLVQLLVPSTAMAARRGPGAGTVICTAVGLQTVSIEDTSAPAQTSSHFDECKHCVCATPPLMAPEPSGVSVPFRYTTHVLRLAYLEDQAERERVLAAPPPPSRGPPRLN